MTTRVLAVVGDPIAHSLSPVMHNAAIAALGLDATYMPLRTTRGAFPALVRGLLEDGGACNVTIPFKLEAAALVSAPTELVRRTGACNTVWGESAAPSGDNTDVAGVQSALESLCGAHEMRGLTLWGTGGSARAAAVAFADAYPGRPVQVVSRSASRARAFAAWARGAGVPCDEAEVPAANLLISTIPLHARPAAGDAPVSLGDHLPDMVLDLAYARGETPLVLDARRRGARAEDGRRVLVAQGEKAFERFFALAPPPDVMWRAVEDALRP